MSASFYASLHYRCAIETILQQLTVQQKLSVDYEWAHQFHTTLTSPWKFHYKLDQMILRPSPTITQFTSTYSKHLR